MKRAPAASSAAARGVVGGDPDAPVAERPRQHALDQGLGATLGLGLVVGGVHAEARVQTPATRSEIGPVLRYLIPRLERQGVATAAELDVDTIDERLDEERRQANATYVGEVMFGGWARSPTT